MHSSSGTPCELVVPRAHALELLQWEIRALHSDRRPDLRRNPTALPPTSPPLHASTDRYRPLPARASRLTPLVVQSRPESGPIAPGARPFYERFRAVRPRQPRMVHIDDSGSETKCWLAQDAPGELERTAAEVDRQREIAVQLMGRYGPQASDVAYPGDDERRWSEDGEVWLLEVRGRTHEVTSEHARRRAGDAGRLHARDGRGRRLQEQLRSIARADPVVGRCLRPASPAVGPPGEPALHDEPGCRKPRNHGASNVE